MVFRDHAGRSSLGTLIALATFVLFYLMTVFALSWGTTALGYSRQQFLLIQLFGILFFARDDSAVRGPGGSLRPAPHAAVGHGGDRRVRLRLAPLLLGGHRRRGA